MADSRWNQFWGNLGPGSDIPRQHPRTGPDGKPLTTDKYDQWGFLGDALRYLNEAPPEAAVPAPPPQALVFGDATTPGAQAPPASLPGVTKGTDGKYYASPDLLAAVMGNESSGGRNTATTTEHGVPHVGAWQTSPAAAQDVGMTHGDPGVGPAYLNLLLNKYGGDPTKALAAYNAGPGAVDAFLAKNPQGDVDSLTTNRYAGRALAGIGNQASPASPWTFPTMQAPDLGGALAELGKIAMPKLQTMPTNTPTATSPQLTPLDKAGIEANFAPGMLPDIDHARYQQVLDAQKHAARRNPLEGTVLGQLLGLLTGGPQARVEANGAQSLYNQDLARETAQRGQLFDVGKVGADVDIKNNATVNQQATNDATVAYQNALTHFNAVADAVRSGNANAVALFQAISAVQTAKANLQAQGAIASATASNATAQGQQGLNMASINAGVGPAAEAAGTASGAKVITRKAGDIAATSGITPNDPRGTQAALGVAANQPERVTNAVANDLFDSGLAATLLDPATYQALLATAAPKDAKGKPIPSGKVDQKALKAAAGQALAASMLAHPDQAVMLIKRAADAGLPSAVAAQGANPQVK